MEEPIEIPLSKTRVVISILLIGLMVLLGLFICLNPDEFLDSYLGSFWIFRLFSILLWALFCFYFVLVLRQLFDRKPGLAITEQGIIDNTSFEFAPILILWEDIMEVNTIKIKSQPVLVIYTYKPEKYINLGKNIYERYTRRSNHRMYGSSIIIGAHSLKISFNELKRLIELELIDRGKTPIL
ncbi:MAG: STM3941 family protein [Bacteroidia bacterium]